MDFRPFWVTGFKCSTTVGNISSALFHIWVRTKWNFKYLLHVRGCFFLIHHFYCHYGILTELPWQPWVKAGEFGRFPPFFPLNLSDFPCLFPLSPLSWEYFAYVIVVNC